MRNTPIIEDTVAKLTSQGITGLSYINLNLGKNTSALLTTKTTDKYPVIKTVPSLFTKLESSFGGVTDGLTNTLVKTNQLLNEQNQKHFASVLKNTALLTKKLNKLLDEKTIKNIQQSAKNLNSSTAKIDALLPNVDKFIDNSLSWENNISTSFNSIMNSLLIKEYS